jgi:ABC-type transport system substrate-binding protein
LLKLPQPRKSKLDAFGEFALMISKAAWISRSKNQIGLTTVPTIPATNETVKDVLGPTVKDVVGLNTMTAHGLSDVRLRAVINHSCPKQ